MRVFLSATALATALTMSAYFVTDARATVDPGGTGGTGVNIVDNVPDNHGGQHQGGPAGGGPEEGPKPTGPIPTGPTPGGPVGAVENVPVLQQAPPTKTATATATTTAVPNTPTPGDTHPTATPTPGSTTPVVGPSTTTGSSTPLVPAAGEGIGQRSTGSDLPYQFIFAAGLGLVASAFFGLRQVSRKR